VASGSVSLPEVQDVFRRIMEELRNNFSGTLVLFIGEMIFMIVIGVINSILMIYVSIALGQLFNGHKVIGSFAAYIAISTVVQIITTVGTILLSFIFRNTVSDINTIPHVIFPFTILFILVLDVVYYWLTDFLFKRKLNLE
jgi:hypothetical protein